MQDKCLDLEFCPRIMGSIPTNARAASDTKMAGSMTDEDMDFEPPTGTVDNFRRMFMDIRKSARRPAG
jgi:hypothetical protein